MSKEELTRQLTYLQYCANQLSEKTSYRLELQKNLPNVIESVNKLINRLENIREFDCYDV